MATGGRPRSEESRRAVLAAAYAAMEDIGFAAMSMEEIARRAGASKATLYRWWPSKAAIVLDAMQEHAQGYPRFKHTGDTRRDLLDELRGVITFYSRPAGRAMLELVARSRFDPDLASALRERFILERRRDTAEVLRRGIDCGQIRADLDIETAMDSIWGSVYYNLLVSHAAIKPKYADRILDAVWPALAPAAGNEGAARRRSR